MFNHIIFALTYPQVLDTPIQIPKIPQYRWQYKEKIFLRARSMSVGMVVSKVLYLKSQYYYYRVNGVFNIDFNIDQNKLSITNHKQAKI